MKKLVGLLFLCFFLVTASIISAQTAPNISYIGPTTAWTGDTIYVYGSNFNQHTRIVLNGDAGPIVETNYISPTSLSFVVPMGMKIGNNTVQVNEIASNYSPSNSVFLNIVFPAQPPTIFSIAPTSAVAGTRINIYGSNFNRNTFAFLTARVNSGQGGSGPFVSTMYHSPTHISFELPSNLEWVGTYNVQVNETASNFSPSNPVPLVVTPKEQYLPSLKLRSSLATESGGMYTTTISWESRNTVKCVADWASSSATSGSVRVTFTRDTFYTMACYGPSNESITDTIHLSVGTKPITAPPPMTEVERQETIRQLQSLLIQLIQQLMTLLQQGAR